MRPEQNEDQGGETGMPKVAEVEATVTAQATTAPKTGQAQDSDPTHTSGVPVQGDVQPSTPNYQDNSDEEDRRGYVAPYRNNAPFPFEVGDLVCIFKPGYRAPLGEFRIVKAHPDDFYELVDSATNVAHAELVEGKYLRRD